MTLALTNYYFMSKKQWLCTGPRLSNNPEAKVVKHPQGPNGEVNETRRDDGSSGNLYFVLGYAGWDGANWVNKGKRIWANPETGIFDSDAAFFEKNKDSLHAEGELKEIPVNPYQIFNKKTGQMVTYRTTKVLLFGGEDLVKITNDFNEQQARRNGGNADPNATKLAQIAELEAKLANDKTPASAKPALEKQIQALKDSLVVPA